MLRVTSLLLLAFLALAVFAGTATVTVAGKTVTIPTIEQNGKSLVDIVALMKLLGGKVTVKPSPTPPAAAPGTGQLPGENGQLGIVYSMVKSNPLFFSLKSAEFTVAPVKVGEVMYTAKAGEKLLVIRFTVQNPHKTMEQFVRWDSLKMTVVDAMNINRESTNWGDVLTQNGVAVSLKPAQKIEAYTAFIVPAKGVVPKLMVMPPTENDGGVLRYDLRGKVTGLKEPFADPADPAGATARETVPMKLNTACPLDTLNLTVEKFAYSTEVPTDADELEEGARYAVFTVLLKNITPDDLYVRWDSLMPMLTSTDGEELHYQQMTFATSARAFAQTIKPGAEARVRLFILVPAEVTPKTLTIRETEESRAYEFEVK